MDASSEERLTKLFVGGINRDTSNDSLRKYFEKFGELSDCVVITDSTTKESRGFGYVTFKDYKSTTDVLNMKQNDGAHVIDGKECEVKRAIPRDSANEFAHQKTNKIFMGGLPEAAKEDDIKELIKSNIGKAPKSIILLMRKEDETKNRGFCFVDLPSEDDADTLFCLRKIDMMGKKVEIKKADPRGRGERGRGRGQSGRGYSNLAYSTRGGANGYGTSGYLGSGYSAGYGVYGSGYGSTAYGSTGYGLGGYSPYDSYGSTPGYSYDSTYGASAYGVGYGSDYGSTYNGYGRLGMYNQSPSGYGPVKSYSMSGSAGRGSYRPY